MQTLNELHTQHRGDFDTVVIDTADWAERLCIQEVCAQSGYTALGGQDDYGRSYNLLETKFCEMLDQLTYMNEQGWHTLVLAHAMVVKVQQPEEIGAYDKWQLALEKKTSKKLKEWPEMVLFLNYRTMVVEDRKTKTKKGTGGQRVAYSTHSPCWDAKCRLQGVPAEFDFEMENGVHQGWEAIKHLFTHQPKTAEPLATPQTAPSSPPPPPAAAATATSAPPPSELQRPAVRKLLAAMHDNGVTWHQVLNVIVAKGHWPQGTPVGNLDDQYIEGRLLPNLPKIAAALKGKAA